MRSKQAFILGSLAFALAASIAAAQNVAYKYDALGRLVNTSQAGVSTTYSYDSADNRTAVTTGGGSSSSSSSSSGPTMINVTTVANLRTLANNAGYNGSSTASYQFVVPAGTTITGSSGGGTAIDTGTWPSGVTLTLVVNGTVYGGGGAGGDGSCSGWSNGTDGSSGGDALSAHAPIAVTVNGTLLGGGGGGGGANMYLDSGTYTECGGGGGGGAPYGSGGNPGGGSGSDQNGGGPGMGDDYYGGTTGGAGGNPGASGEGAEAWYGGGNGGAPGLSARSNGYSVPVSGPGTY